MSSSFSAHWYPCYLLWQTGPNFWPTNAQSHLPTGIPLRTRSDALARRALQVERQSTALCITYQPSPPTQEARKEPRYQPSTFHYAISEEGYIGKYSSVIWYPVMRQNLLRSEGKPGDDQQSTSEGDLCQCLSLSADYFFGKISPSRHLPIVIAGGVECYLPVDRFDLNQVGSVPRRQWWFI